VPDLARGVIQRRACCVVEIPRLARHLERDTQHVPNRSTSRTVNTLYIRGLTAEYAVVRTPNAEWVALGSVWAADNPAQRPTWLLTGAGASPDEALQRLRDQLEAEAERRV
jgi:hypothetical protein